MSTSHMSPTVIVGAGLAGLAAALRLQQLGEEVLVLEAGDGPGGRVRSDVVDGFTLDRGFQVFLTSYERASGLLDIPALELGTFLPGALVRVGDRFARAADPWRQPHTALSLSWLRVIAPSDALRLTRLRALCRRAFPKGVAQADEAASIPKLPTADWLGALGFSAHTVEHFFRPFFGGVFLNRGLTTPAPVFARVFARFSRGLAALPARGMQALPDQLATRLPAGALRLGAGVAHVDPETGTITLADGHRLTAGRTLLATGLRAARQLLPPTRLPTPPPAVLSTPDEATTTHYFALPRAGAPASPALSSPTLLLGGPGAFIHHAACLTAVRPSLAPADQHLLTASRDGEVDASPTAISTIRAALGAWLGVDPGRLTHLRSDPLPHALPAQSTASIDAPGFLAISPTTIVTGDDLGDRSIEGAIGAGLDAAEALLRGARAAA